MKRIFFGFVLGVITGAIGLWQLQQILGVENIQRAGTQVSQGAESISVSVRETFSDLTPEAIQEELSATSMIVREKAMNAGQIIKDATANARLTAAIKYKLFTESNLPGMRINVDSAGGLVTLSGTVKSHDQIGRAVRLALDTEGVTKVVSTIQVE